MLYKHFKCNYSVVYYKWLSKQSINEVNIASNNDQSNINKIKKL